MVSVLPPGYCIDPEYPVYSYTRTCRYLKLSSHASIVSSRHTVFIVKLSELKFNGSISL